MQFTNEFIGSRLIETITSGLYDGNLNCLREYIQNAIDSNAENISIYFENGGNDLIIKDDGDGMDREDLKNALRIGVSNKSVDNVGWRGIGIWSGVSASKSIAIITKKRNDNKLWIEINNEKLRSESRSNKPVLSILSSSTSDIEDQPLGKNESYENDHYTMIRLESILPPQRNIFNEKKIIKFLSRVVPAPFNENRFSFAKEINDWLNKYKISNIKTNITFQDEKIYRPPFESDIFLKDIIKKEFKVKEELVAVGWALSNMENKALQEPNRGIYFKKKGFTLGDDENLVRNQYTGTYHPWQYGEIHIISPELIETAARNSLEYNNQTVGPFLEEISEFVRLLEQQNHYKSNKNPLNQIVRSQKYVDSGDIKLAKKQLTKAKSQLEAKRGFPTDSSFKEMKATIDKESERNRKTVEDLNARISQPNQDLLKKKKDELDSIINGLPTDVKNSIKRASSKGRMHPEMSVTDSIVDILKRKTGLQINEVRDLSKEAYGWSSVNPSDKDPLIIFDKRTDKHSRNRNLRLGVMIYAIHDILVNSYKHEKGAEALGWFEDVNEEEKYEILAEMYGAIGLIYRLIEKSEKYKP